VTEVPEHLLQRSRDRRAALGLGGGGEGAAPATSTSEAAGTDVEASADATAAAPAAAAPAEVEVKPPEPVPPYVEAALQRKRIPFWAMPVVGLLPIWVILYAGSLSPADTGGPSQLDLGAEVYAASCASCHGGGGGGGVGRPLSDGEVLKTFPTIAEQIAFVAAGTDGVGVGNPYGAPDREGGPHIAGSFNGNKMPSFLETLTPEELLAVVRHERETLSGEEVPAEEAGDDETRVWPNGNPIFEEGGTELLSPDGEPLLDPATGLLLIAGSSG
jgi:mono/diheme cytochrome c family protein